MLVVVFFFFLFNLLITAGVSEGSRILLLPANVDSHFLYFSQLAQSLSELGNQVMLVAPSAKTKVSLGLESTKSNLTIANYAVRTDFRYANSKENADVMVRLILSKSLFEQIPLSIKFFEGYHENMAMDCVNMFEDADLMQAIKKHDPQFAIMDILGPQCYLVLPYSLGVPYGMLSLPFLDQLYRIPRLPSFSSLDICSDERSFGERFMAFMNTFVSYMLFPSNAEKYVERFAPEKPIIGTFELFRRLSLWFFLEDLSMGFPKPHMPNTVSVGDIMARPGKPLPDDLAKIIDESDEHVVLMSMGSYFDHVPEFLTAKFCDAFRKVKYRVIWKSKNTTICPGVDRIVVLPWIPQNDLLAHKKVSLFITHGGLNSVIEAAYHATPMIVVPITIDQPANAIAVATKGYGLYMSLADFTPDEMSKGIHQILSDKTFSRNAAKVSAIMRNKKNSPAERVSDLVEQVTKHGDEHLRTGAFKLWSFQFWMFDIFLVIVVCFVLFFSFLCLFFYGLYRATIRCFGGKRIKVKKT